MRLDDVQLARLFPAWMRDDEVDGALAGVTDDVTREVYAAAELLTVWDKLDELPEAMLDQMADALHIEWYESGATVEEKRDLIRTSDLIHANKGTVTAVEQLIDIYFGGGRIMEWPEYGGKPHHFKAYTTDPTAVAQNHQRFLHYLAMVKRHSSKLDSVLIGLRGKLYGYAGMGLVVSDRLTVTIKPDIMNGSVLETMGIAVSVADRVTIKMSVPEWML